MMRQISTAVASLILVLCVAATAAVPPMINYQGKLLQPSGAPVPDGTYQMQFAIYDVPTGGTALWSETNSSVQVKGGLFATMLGSVNNLPANIFDNQNRWFGVKVGNDPEMTPRQQVASSAFAFRAATAGTVDDGAIATAKLADGAVTMAKLGDVSVTAAKLGDGAVTTAKIGDASIVGSKIADSSISSVKLDTSAVRNSNVAGNAGILSSKIDFTAMAFLGGQPIAQPKIACGVFSIATVAGQRVEKTLDYDGVTFLVRPVIVVTPAVGTNLTSDCHVSVQENWGSYAKIWITDSVSNGSRLFHWIAIGY